MKNLCSQRTAQWCLLKVCGWIYRKCTYSMWNTEKKIDEAECIVEDCMWKVFSTGSVFPFISDFKLRHGNNCLSSKKYRWLV